VAEAQYALSVESRMRGLLFNASSRCYLACRMRTRN